MNSFYLSDGIKITVDDPTGSAGTEVDSTILDMAEYDDVIFVAHIGTANAGNYLKVQQDTDSAMGAAADLAGSKAASSASIKVLATEVLRPEKRYVRAAIIRAGINTTVDTIVAIQCRARNLPVAQAAAVALTRVQAPAEGSA